MARPLAELTRLKEAKRRIYQEPNLETHVRVRVRPDRLGHASTAKKIIGVKIVAMSQQYVSSRMLIILFKRRR